MKRTVAYVTLYLSFLSCQVSAQNSNFSVKHYTAGNGLPSGIIEDVTWDSSGFMWISTLKGIVRFDGIWMRSFTKNNYPGITGDYTSPITRDDRGRSIFCDGNDNIFGFSDYKPVLLDTSYRVGITGGNYFALPLPSRFWNPVLRNYNDSFGNSNEAILIDSLHFILGMRKKLLRYDLRSGTYAVLHEFPEEIKLFKMGRAIYVYEKNRSLYKLSFSVPNGALSLRAIQVPFSLNNAKIYWRNGMEAGILVEKRDAFLLELHDENFVKMLICDDLPNDIYIVNIKYDLRSHTTAIACDGDGVYLYKKRLLHSYVQRSSNILSISYSFYTQIEMRPGELWLNGGRELDIPANRFSATTSPRMFQSTFKIKDSLAFFHFAIFPGDYSIWCYSFKTRTLTQRFTTAKTESGAFAMTEKRLFFANDNGLIELTASGDSVFFPFKVQSRNTINIARDMIEFRPGYLVFCGEVGVFGFDIHTKKIDTLLNSRGTEQFRNVVAYKGYLLLSQYSDGIWVLKDKKARLLPFDKNQYLRFVSNIYIDSNLNAWIAADGGIFKIKADSLIGQFYSTNTDPANYLKCEYYGKEDGLDISELNGGRQGSMIRLENGELSYAGINGIVNADISGAGASDGCTAIIADKIVVDGQTLPDSTVHSGMQLSSKTENIKMYFNIPIWSNPYNMIIEYRLSGQGHRWEEFDFAKQNYIELKNQPSGDYVLEVRASPAFDQSRPVKLAFSFEIATPWYKTTLSYTLALLLMLVIIISIFRWRLFYLEQKNKTLTKQVAKQVEAINRQKTELEEQIGEMSAYQERLEKDYALKNRLISIIGHDIITPLRFMNRAGKALLTRKETINQATFDETLKTILATGAGLQDMAVNMLNWIKHHHETMQFMLSEFDVFEKVDEMIQNIKPMAEFKQLRICNQIPKGVIVRQYCDPFKTIALQLLTNSIKYSEKGSILITATIGATGILVSVTDEGMGMPPGMISHLVDAREAAEFTDIHENSGHGFGFLIIKDMLEIIKGKVHIDSVVNEGTTVTICFPVNMAKAIE